MNRSLAMQNQLLNPRMGIMLATTALLLCTGSTNAQYALGGGDRLDANPSRVTGRTNLPAAVPDFRSRNLTVTGDVAGGRGFRGDVGYTAPGDFRGQLGGDDTFRFRADSAYSSPAAAGLPEQFRFGHQLGVMEFRRGGPDLTPQSVVPDSQRALMQLSEGSVDDRIRMDQIIRGSAITERQMLTGNTRTVGTAVDEEGRPFLIEVSPLRGFEYASAMDRFRTQGLTPLDRMRLRDDMATGRVTNFGAPVEWRFEQLAEQERMAEYRPSQLDRLLPDDTPRDARMDQRESDPLDTRLDPRRSDFDADPRQRDRLATTPPSQQFSRRPVEAQHLQIIERIARRYAGAEDVDVNIDPQLLRELDEEFAQIRDRLTQRDVAPFDPRVQLEDIPVDPDDQPDDRRTERQPEDAYPEGQIDPDRAIPLLRHGQRIEQLTGTEQTRFNELMQQAEQSLRDGEYFMAERQFLRALRFHPNQPLATAGMAHAQIGAGLHIAASLTLQRLFSTNPEMIDVRYDASLLPSRARLAQVVDNLESRMNERRDRDAVAFLLAYIGHQLQDRALVDRGLSAMSQQRPENDLLLQLLQGVWQAEQPAGK